MKKINKQNNVFNTFFINNNFMPDCVLCRQSLPNDPTRPGVARFECGHIFHLRCVLNHATNFRTACPSCDIAKDLAPNLGGDRCIAIAANAAAARRRRMLYPTAPQSTGQRLWNALVGSSAVSLAQHIQRGTKINDLQRLGFGPDDLVAENVHWNTLVQKYNATDILNFGVRWNHAVRMGVRPSALKMFTWAQLRHCLNISARDLMSIDVSITDLAEMNISPAHLVDMGFDWKAMESLGASVETLKALSMSVADIKTYFKPNAREFERAGFYDKQRLLKSGWDVDRVTSSIPASGWRANGRVRRANLEF